MEIRTLADQSFYEEIRPMVHFIWKVNLGKKDVKLFCKKGFWYDVLVAWCKFKWQTPNNKSKIRNQSIWFNSSIRYDDKPIYCRNAIVHGLLKVEQVLNDEGYFRSFTEIQQVWGNTINFIEYETKCDSFPYFWKQLLRKEGPDGDLGVDYTEMILRTDIGMRWIYTELISGCYFVEEKKRRWEQIFNKSIETEDFLKCFQRNFQISNISEMRSFHFRMLHLTTVVQYQYRQMDECTFCAKE